LREMVTKNIPAQAAQTGSYFQTLLCERLGPLPNVNEIRGLGLMIGIELTHPGAAAVKACLERGLIINCTMGNVLRLLPPLIATKAECEKAADIITQVLQLDEVQAAEGAA